MVKKYKLNFKHPWFTNCSNVCRRDDVVSLVCLFIEGRKDRNTNRDYMHEGINRRTYEEDAPTRKSLQRRVFQWIFAFPAVCDLFGTTLATIGLLYVKASVWQMLRGSIIIFTGLLSKIFLKRKLWPIHWIGMIVTVVGGIFLNLFKFIEVFSGK
ncbi:uncharacterized protein LOC111345517 [Stylophora pistillata]|uniref:uncharacterized protein LOC111345517 n=1 Tax=Stylophora pistillata TaxID=50429 RepID=UPI000C04DDA1|nr:uncharacterized protein LOC111345517 [Stylophora pistillata]